MNHEELRELSIRLEHKTGYDSIPTIERIYVDDFGSKRLYACVWPRCAYRCQDSGVMWRHVHFGPHGLSFGVKTPEEAA